MNAIMRIEVQVLTRAGIAQLRDLQNAIAGVAASGKAVNATSLGGAAASSTVNSLGRLSASLESSGLALTKWGKNMQWTGRQLTTAFTLPLAIAAGVAVDLGLKQTAAFNQVQRALIAGGEGAKQLASDLPLLQKGFTALSDTYGVQLEQVDQIGAAWAAAGDKGGDLARAVELTLQTMILGNMGYQDTVTFLIALRTQYGLTADQATAAVATIAAAAGSAGATFGDMVNGLSRTGGAAAQFGLNVQQTVAAIAALTPSMGSAYRAGIALQTILVRLNAPSVAGIKAFHQLGIEVAGPQGLAWRSATAAEKLQMLADKTKNLNDAQKTQALSDITSKLQVTRAIELLDEITNKQSQYNKVLAASGDAKKNAAEAQKQISALLASDPQALKIVWTQLENSLAQIGILIVPILLNFAKGIAQLVGEFDNLSPRTKAIILWGLGFLMIIGPIVRYMGAFATLAGVALRAAGTFLGIFSTEEATATGAIQAQIAALGEVVAASTNAAGEIVGVAAVQAEQMSALLTQLAGVTAAYTEAQAANGDKAAAQALADIDAIAAEGAAMQQALLDEQARWAAGIAAQDEWLANFTTDWDIATTTVIAAEQEQAAATAAANAAFLADFETTMAAAVATAMEAHAAMSESVSQAEWLAAFTADMTEAQAAAMEAAGITGSTWTESMGVAGTATGAWLASFEADMAEAMTAAMTVAAEMDAMWETAAAVRAAADAGAAAEAVAAFTLVGDAAITAGLEAGAGFAVGIETGVELGAAAIPILIAVAVLAAAALFWKFRDDIFQVFTDIKQWVIDVFQAFPLIVAASFEAVINVIASAAKAIYSWLSYLNPFAKHSPSLIDNVKNGTKQIGDHYENLHKRLHAITGVKKSATSHTNPLSVLNPYTKHSPSLVESVEAGINAIATKYKSLKGLGAIFSGAEADLVKFKKDLNDTALSLDRVTLEDKRAKIVKFAPAAGPEVEVLINQILNLESQLPKLASLFAQQEAAVARWSVPLGKVNDELAIQNDRLTILTDTANKYKVALDKGQQDLQTITSTPIQGQKAMGDQIFANDQAQKQLNLDMLKIADSVGVTGNVADQLAKINGQMELLKGKREDLRQAGAGSDVLAGLDGQIGALGTQSNGLATAAVKIAALQTQLDKLGQTGQELNLEQSLKFDPLVRQLDQVANGIRELPFSELLDKAKKTRASNDLLTVSYNDAELKVIAQNRVVADLTATRDKLQLGYDIENQKLTALGTAYDAITSQISDMTSALDDLIQKQAAAKSTAGDLAGLGGGVKTPSLNDLPQGNDDLASTVQGMIDNMNKSFKNMKVTLPNPVDLLKGWIKGMGIKGGVLTMLTGIGIAVGTAIGGPVGAVIGGLVGGGIGKLITNGNIMTSFQEFDDKMFGYGKTAIQFLWHGISDYWMIPAMFFKNLGSTVLAYIGDAGIWLGGVAHDIITGFWTVFSAQWTVPSAFFKSMGKKILSYVGSALGWLGHTGAAAVSGFYNGIGAAWTKVSGFFRSVGGKIPSYVGSLLGTLVHAGSAVIGGFWTGITGRWGGIGTFFSGIGNRVVSGIGSLLGTLVGVGKDLMTGLWNGIKSGWNYIADHFKIKIPSVGVGPIHTPAITIGLPHLAKGGIIPATPGGMAAIMGEAGRSEAVMPLPRGMDLGTLANLMRDVQSTQLQFIKATAGSVNLHTHETQAATHSVTRVEKTVNNNFYGDMNFPNVKTGDDAEAFVKNLESMV